MSTWPETRPGNQLPKVPATTCRGPVKRMTVKKPDPGEAAR
jgi:hypothetical protein